MKNHRERYNQSVLTLIRLSIDEKITDKEGLERLKALEISTIECWWDNFDWDCLMFEYCANKDE